MNRWWVCVNAWKFKSVLSARRHLPCTDIRTWSLPAVLPATRVKAEGALRGLDGCGCLTLIHTHPANKFIF